MVKRMLRVCTELERISRVVTENARADARSGRLSKRKATTDLETMKEYPPFQRPPTPEDHLATNRGSRFLYFVAQDLNAIDSTRDMFPAVSEHPLYSLHCKRGI